MKTSDEEFCCLTLDPNHYNPWADHIHAVADGSTYFSSQDLDDLLTYMNSECEKIKNLEIQLKQSSSTVDRLMREIEQLKDNVQFSDMVHQNIVAELIRTRANMKFWKSKNRGDSDEL